MANGPRLYNAAPGAETRYRNGSIGSANGIFTSSLFPNRTIANRRYIYLKCIHFEVTEYLFIKCQFMNVCFGSGDR